MESWLEEFKKMNLIYWDQNDGAIHLLRLPTPEEEAEAYQKDALFM